MENNTNHFCMYTLQGHDLIYTFTGEESLTDLAVEAAGKALEMAEVHPNDVDLILMCSSTGDDRFGSAPVV